MLGPKVFLWQPKQTCYVLFCSKIKMENAYDSPLNFHWNIFTAADIHTLYICIYILHIIYYMRVACKISIQFGVRACARVENRIQQYTKGWLFEWKSLRALKFDVHSRAKYTLRYKEDICSSIYVCTTINDTCAGETLYGFNIKCS